MMLSMSSVLAIGGPAISTVFELRESQPGWRRAIGIRGLTQNSSQPLQSLILATRGEGEIRQLLGRVIGQDARRVAIDEVAKGDLARSRIAGDLGCRGCVRAPLFG